MITDGGGEELRFKNSLFGRKVRMVKDRFGDGYALQKGFLSGKDTEMSLLGNHIHRHRGLFGGSEMSGSTILGDRFATKKGLFGKRKMAFDLSGTGGLLKGLFNRPMPLMPVPMPQGMPPYGMQAAPQQMVVQ